MSILIDQNGKVFVNESAVNKLLSPVQIGKFVISHDAKQFIEAELNESNANQLFQFIPKDMHAFCQDKKLIPTKASIFKRQAIELSQTRSEASQTPHINSGEESHFFFDGSYIIYFNINGQHFSLIVQAGDWIFIPADIEHWIKETADHYLVIVSYHCEPFEIFHSKVKYTTTKSHAFLRFH
jgi:cupin superfamily acireductone dioxygenase involved in methionine salvage